MSGRKWKLLLSYICFNLQSIVICVAPVNDVHCWSASASTCEKINVNGNENENHTAVTMCKYVQMDDYGEMSNVFTLESDFELTR